MTKIVYYVYSNGENPVKKFIESLSKKQKAKIFRIFEYVQIYGLSSILPHVKKVVATPIWEIRILGKDNIRILYITKTEQDEIVVLHAFFKKQQKTPQKELDIALKRLYAWKNS